MMTVGDLIMT